ncbi:MAG: hypothetical protein CL947_01895 [Epsilonproteobacteria bacterium]|nr:hypothetical protein [Campylobacterota bacterium]|tara:strand:+ start:771 stop:1265 length:495 start_codon:yes stop_codon:yes gene_type:complete
MNNKQSLGLNPYLILFVILGAIVCTTLIVQFFLQIITLKDFMRIFMGLFFIVFGFFKVLNWKGFVYAFSEYDIIASKVKLYAYGYPLIEFFLGIMYLSNSANLAIHVITALIMFMGSIGVLLSLQQQKEIQCACLGTVVKLPISSITLIEDVGMGVMALYMIFM